MCNTKWRVFLFVAFSLLYSVAYVVFPNKISYFNSINKDSPLFKNLKTSSQRIIAQGTSKIPPKCVGWNTDRDTLWFGYKSFCNSFILRILLKNDLKIINFDSKWLIDVKSGAFYYHNKQNIKMCLVIGKYSFATIEKCSSTRISAQEFKLFEYKPQNGLYSLGKQAIFTYSCFSKFFCFINLLSIFLYSNFNFLHIFCSI